MRKVCAKLVDGVFISNGSFLRQFFLDRVIRILSYLLSIAYSQFSFVFTQAGVGGLTDMSGVFSTNSTGLITITTFYKKGSLITHRGIT